MNTLKPLKHSTGRKISGSVHDDAREALADLDAADPRSRLGRAKQVRCRAAEQRGARGAEPEEQLPLAGVDRALAGADIIRRAAEALHTDGQHAHRGTYFGSPYFWDEFETLVAGCESPAFR